MKRRRVFVGILTQGYSKAVVAAIQLLMVPVLAHAWGLQLYGQWLLLSAIPVFLGASDFGFGSAAGNRLIGEVARRDIDDALCTFQSALAVVISASLVMLLATVLACLFLPDHVLGVERAMSSANARMTLALLCGFGLVALQSSLFMAVMRSIGKFALSTSLDATIQLCEGLAVIAVVLNGGSPVQAALTYVVIRIAGVACHIWFALLQTGWLRLGFKRATRVRIAELTRPALAAMLMPLAQAGYVQGTALAVGAAAGPAMVPIYTSLRTLSRVSMQFVMMLNLPVLPDFTGEFARGNSQWVRKVAGGLISLNLAVGIGAGLSLALFGTWLLDLWTKGAIRPPEAMIVLTAIGLTASTLWNPISSVLLATNRHEAFSYVFVLMAAISTASTYLFVGRWGVTGVAVANLALDGTMFLCAIFMLRRVVGDFRIGIAPLRHLLGAG